MNTFYHIVINRFHDFQTHKIKKLWNEWLRWNGKVELFRKCKKQVFHFNITYGWFTFNITQNYSYFDITCQWFWKVILNRNISITWYEYHIKVLSYHTLESITTPKLVNRTHHDISSNHHRDEYNTLLYLWRDKIDHLNCITTQTIYNANYSSSEEKQPL